MSKLNLGRSCWIFLHNLAENWSEIDNYNTESNFKSFMYFLSEIYPCDKCRIHMKKYFDKHPIVAKNKKEIKLYLCNFHNAVNLRLNKPIFKCN